MSAKGIRAGKAFVEIGADSAPLSAALMRLRGRVQAFGRSLAQAAMGLAAAGAAGAASLAWPVRLAANLQTSQVAFETMLGSAEAATALLGQLRDFAASTPFQLPELQQASKLLIAFGTSAGSVVGELRMLGDIASGVGIPLSELAEIYGKNRVQGRLFAEDMNQLTGRGIPIIGELAKQFGVAESEVRQLVTDGKVGFEDLRRAMESLATTGIFAGGMEKQSKTLIGLWSTLQDSIANAILPIGEALLPALSSAVERSIEWTTALGQVTQGFAAIAQEVMGLNVQWNETTEAMRNEWYSVVDLVLDAWTDASTGIAVGAAQIYFAVVGQFEKMRDRIIGLFEGIKNWWSSLPGLPEWAKFTPTDTARAAAGRNLSAAERGQERERYLQMLVRLGEEEKQNRRSGRNDSAQAIRQQIDTAQKQLQEAATQATQQPKLGEMDKAATAASNATQSIVGQFNATLAGQQVGIKDLQNRTAKASEKTARNTEKLVMALGTSGVLIG